MPTELWARNPGSYVKYCLLADLTNFVFDVDYQKFRNMDPQQFGLFHVPPSKDFEILSVGKRLASHHDRRHPWNAPKGVYPVWKHGWDHLDQLEAWMAENQAEKMVAEAKRARLGSWVTASRDQEHRVVVKPGGRMPSHSLPWRRFRLLLSELQQEYPNCVLHFAGGASYPWSVGLGYGAITLNFAKPPYSFPVLVLANGSVVSKREVYSHAKWVRMLGFRTSDIETRAGRLEFNIRAAQWAIENWHGTPDTDFGSLLDPLNDDDIIKMLNREEVKSAPVVARAGNRTSPKGIGDKFYCDRCSFASQCRAFRAGSVCTLTNSDATDLIKFFRTRNSARIIEGLTGIMEVDLRRLSLGLEVEKDKGELSPDVSKLTKSLFDQGERLAKLIDPTLRPNGVSVNVNSGGNTQVGVVTGGAVPMQTLASRAMSALEEAGVPRNQITADLVKDYISVQGDPDALEELIYRQVTKYELPVFSGGGEDAIEIEDDEAIVDPEQDYLPEPEDAADDDEDDGS